MKKKKSKFNNFIKKYKNKINTFKANSSKKFYYFKKRIKSRPKKNNFLFKILKYSFIIFVCLHQFIVLIILILSILLTFLNPKITSLMIFRNGLRKQKNNKIIFIPLKYIPKRIQANVIGVEDEHFYKHIGIDPEAITRAYNINKRLGYKHSGGSTITQQLARTLFLIPKKNYLRKYLEIVIALELDLILPKKRILELYFNYIEFGNGIYGIGRASYYYYSKSFYDLNKDEINKLITIIPSPIKYNPDNFYINDNLLSRYQTLTVWTF